MIGKLKFQNLHNHSIKLKLKKILKTSKGSKNKNKIHSKRFKVKYQQ